MQPFLYAIAYLLTSLASVFACAAVLFLSQYNQEGQAYQALPFLLIILLGLLFAAPLHAFKQRLGAHKETNDFIFPVVALILGVIAAWLLSTITIPSPVLNDEGVRLALLPSSSFILAPIVAVLSSEALRFFKHAQLIAAMLVYITCTLLANYTFNSFIPVPFYGLINVGTLFFGITFTQRDRVHQHGRKWAYLMIMIAAVSNVLLALHLETPLRYVWVSFAAITISEFMDTQIYHSLLQRNWWLRVGASNAVSIPLDSTIFTVFAFYGEVWATPQWMLQVIITDIIVKLIVGFIAAIGVARHDSSDSSDTPSFPRDEQGKRQATKQQQGMNRANIA